MTSSSKWNEKQLVENRMIEQLKELGYEHFYGPFLDSERESKGEIVLKERLSKSILRLNPWLSDINLSKVIRSITHIESTSLMEANQKFYEMIVNMISVQQDLGKGKKNQTVRLIDFERPENNEFLVVDQFTISNAQGNIRPDVIIFINGLPLIIVECKSPMLPPDEQIGEGVRQLHRYQSTHEQLFHYNQFLIVTSNDRAKTGTIGAKVQHYGEWKDLYPKTVAELGVSPTLQDILTAGMLTKESLLDLIRNFIVYEPVEGRTIKKLARYQQFRAVNKAIDRILCIEDKEQRGGVVWHTQGSGKSLTMVYLAVKLRRIKELKNPTIVVVTDRKDLDDQITNTFRRCGFPNPQQAESVAQLRQLLQQGTGSTVMTLVQKFQEDAETKEFKNLSTAENIFVMIDESHRSQYGGLATTMKSAMPNACYLAFTGTPIDKEDKSTKRTFGPYIDKYTIEQAVEDGATVPIFYEARMVDLHVQGDSLDELFERQFREYSEEDRERIKKKYATEQAIISSQKRIKRIVLDIIEHYETHIQPNGFKAQIVAISREAAVMYKEMLDELSNYESKVIMSAGHNDMEHLQTHHLSKDEEKDVIACFKKPMSEDKLCFLIVCDKLLTGFDAPIEQVMYLDKPIKEHNLLQAIARTNRTYDKKTYGLIVDYYGVSRFLEQALAIFNKEDVQGALQNIDTEIPRLQSRHRSAMRFFDYISTDNLEACLQVLEPEDIRNEFDTAFKRFSESMDMVMPSPKAHDYIVDLKFLGKVRQAAKSRYRVDGMDISDCGEKVKQLIEEHLAAVGIDVVHEPIDILSNRFEKQIDETKTPEGKAAEMEHAIRHEIRVKLEKNPVYYTSLKERLEELLQRRRDRQMDIDELLEEYRNMVNDMRNTEQKGEEYGFTREQYPFYQMLEKEMPPYDDVEDLKALTHLITDIIQLEADIVEWTNKEDVKREMRKRIKKQLRVSPCPKEKLESLTQQLIDLATVHYKK
ncbi:Type I restriction-modification system, restriction subunit R [Bacillus mycoides]|uniref:type I restriction endonuclease subunit R n=1 Tax=Bacillus mycoides TaxID=1405 RepID=UPI000A27DA05|nr:type I restriction endonuclease subunit R [Bacillus mycoides]OSY16399.1 Type I restriction-modification system, restriction subunit R [Bacillus mycoides]